MFALKIALLLWLTASALLTGLWAYAGYQAYRRNGRGR